MTSVTAAASAATAGVSKARSMSAAGYAADALMAGPGANGGAAG